MAGKRTLMVLMLSLLASVGCRGMCERWYPCQQPMAAYPMAAPAANCVPCVPCCPPGVSGYNAPAAVPAPSATPGWNAPVTRGAAPCVPCQ